MKRAVGGYDSNLFQGTQCQRIVVCTAAAAAASASGAVYLRAGLYCCVRCCLCLSPLPRAVLLLRAMSFPARGAVCAPARCGVRGVLMRAVLHVPQPCAVRVLCARSLLCARCCLCFSPMPRALLHAACAAAAVREEFCCARCCCCARGVLLRAGLPVFQRVAACSAAAVCESAVCN